MSKADVIEVEGKVVEKLPNAMFRVKLETAAILCWLLFPANEDEFHPYTARG